MKKIYALLLVAATSVLSAAAQPFQKGDKLLGGSIYFMNRNESGANNHSSTLLVSPSLGFFTKSNRLTGVALTFGSNISGPFTKNYGVSIYRQYWNNLGKNVFFIVQGDASLSYYRSRYYYNSSPVAQFKKEKGYGISAGISPGFAYRINKRLVVDAFVNDFISISDFYSKIEENYLGSNITSRSNNNDFRFNTNLNAIGVNSFLIGFRYIL